MLPAVALTKGAPTVTVAHSMGCLSVLWALEVDGLVPERQVLLAPLSTTASMMATFSRSLERTQAELARRFERRMQRPLTDFDVPGVVERLAAARRLGPA